MGQAHRHGGHLAVFFVLLEARKGANPDQTTLPGLLATKSIARRHSRGFTGMSFSLSV